MTKRTIFLVALLAATFGSPAPAQQSDAESAPGDAQEQFDIAAEMRAAEERLEEAARRIAELSARQLPRRAGQQWAFAFSDRPLLGVTIDGDAQSGPVEGVVVRGVSPGGAAFEAGLKAGDIISAINDESLSAGSSMEANDKLLAFMDGVEPGDTLDVEYLRDGQVAKVELKPRANSEHHFSFGMPGHAPTAPTAPVAPVPPIGLDGPVVREIFRWHDSPGWRDMELTPLTPDLGRYFGTEEGLLVVRAPSGGELQLKDGDVIQSIDGRQPETISHAMRILASYEPGEKIRLEIMRDKRRRTLEVTLPDDRLSRLDDGDRPRVKRIVRRRVDN